MIEGEQMAKYQYDITIVVPCYNCSKYVDEMMSSILNQDYDYYKIEVLLINDGSTDDTLEVIKKYEHDNVRIFSKSNEGVSATRNLGLQQATGRYILFLDPDDYISDVTIGKLITFFDAHSEEIDLVTYPILYVYPDKRPMVHKRYKNCYTKNTAVYDLNDDYYLVQPTINVCVKNDLNIFFDTKQGYSEDEKFNTTILMRKQKIGFVADATYYYRRHTASITSSRDKINLEKIYKYYDELQSRYNNHPFIQAVIVNNYNWRIREGCLYPTHMPISEIDTYLMPATQRLNQIDFTLFRQQVVDNQETFYHLLALSQQKCSVKLVNDKYQLVHNKQVLVDNVDVRLYINYGIFIDHELVFNGYVVSPLFYAKKVKFYVEYDTEPKIEIELFNELSYQLKYKRYFKLKIDPTKRHQIKFYLQYQEKMIRLNVEPIDWCSFKKIYNGYQVIINGNVMIKKRTNLSRLVNRFGYCHKMKFLVINTLSFVTRKGRKCSLYFGDRDSAIYQQYLDDRNPNKRFYSRAVGYKYKMELLNCDRLITDKRIQLVIPFGGMRKYYIQASHFQKDI